MYTCKVGTGFKIGFFKRFLNFCYDRKKGEIYSSDLFVLQKLGIERDKILECLSDVVKPKVEKVENEAEKRILALEQNFKDLRKEKVLLEQTIRELVDFNKELLEIDDENEALTTVKSSIGILNRKIKQSNETLDSLKERFEVLVEMFSEHSSKTDQLPNVLRTGMTLERIWNSVGNKNSAAILSIMYMMKKALEEKGTRIS